MAPLPGAWSWGQPLYGFGLLLLPAAWWLVHRRRRRSRGVIFTRLDAASQLARLPGQALRLLPDALRALAAAALIAALARPQLAIRTPVAEETAGVDLVLALDISDSMRAGDLRPSRLAAAKQVLADFVRARPAGDRIGLVAFSGASYTAAPLTLDRESLLQTLGELTPGAVAIDGTAIGDGLLTAVARLAEGAEPAPPGREPGRAVILATDGSNNRGGDPLAAAALAAARGARVDVIGLGSRERVRRWGEDDWGRSAPLSDLYGNPIYWDALDEALLARIAAAGRGRYFRAADRDELGRCLAEIDRLQKQTRRLPDRVEVRELFPFALGLALGLLVLERVLARTRLRSLA